ncbi:hypothetical protein O6H91_12G055200 [Diphasiastrum complanatum]|uniref:Uncharacterized protein n=1 Tax=Diphasiastrum complanatum TaxID=34168 RepID=A0ACC2C242_DIPCM|nr:hypothetical protein O6H91_12G055200 [Diphasiastrum complanatum]
MHKELIGFKIQLAVARALTGAGLAVVIPAMKSLIADATDDSSRGVAFGWLQLTGSMGSALGSIISVLLAGTTFLGIPGWRLSFLIVAFFSAVVAYMVHKFAIDPRPVRHHKHNKTPGSYLADVKDLTIEAKKVMKIKTFQVIVAQGVLGSFPWASLAFAAMWLELIGFSHNETASLIGTFTVSVSLGGLFGGRLGDILSIRLPNTGRILLAQISSGLGPPLAAILLLALPYNPSTAPVHGFFMFIWGFFTSWNSCATNSPIFAEIVPEKSRTLTYALDRSFESILASFAPPIVGLLAERMYGYVATPETSMEDTAVKTNQQNAIALGKAVYTAYAIPLTICCMIYTLLYYTYPKDRDKAQADALIDSQSFRRLGLGSKKLSDLYLYTEAKDKGKISSPKADYSETEIMLPKEGSEIELGHLN